MPAPEPRDIRALAVDYDRTLTGPDLEPSLRVLDALATARKAGLRVIVISGRDLEFLDRHVGEVVDVIVGENGCMLLEPGSDVVHLGEHERDLRKALACLDVPVEHGRVMASAEVEHEPLLRETLERAGFRVDLIRNRDRVMILPLGIDKAVGLAAALDILGVAPEACAAGGDGENDVVLLRSVGYAIAVENAVDDLKKVAHHVARRYGGEGIADWIEHQWLPAQGVQAR